VIDDSGDVSSRPAPGILFPAARNISSAVEVEDNPYTQHPALLFRGGGGKTGFKNGRQCICARALKDGGSPPNRD